MTANFYFLGKSWGRNIDNTVVSSTFAHVMLVTRNPFIKLLSNM